jgi:hypothetical protein
MRYFLGIVLRANRISLSIILFYARENKEKIEEDRHFYHLKAFTCT